MLEKGQRRTSCNSNMCLKATNILQWTVGIAWYIWDKCFQLGCISKSVTELYCITYYPLLQARSQEGVREDWTIPPHEWENRSMMLMMIHLKIWFYTERSLSSNDQDDIAGFVTPRIPRSHNRFWCEQLRVQKLRGRGSNMCLKATNIL